ncbi:alpha/beta fold hydrolase [Haliangium ochraceum]|uniref:Alpha/beta hydrolase fold protein n=1 Tax=Haliangium ochraceum (strain DSM 14365 / JCM 11303 / SMP-2) TaxID=502025 RepID=D0LUV7_HALO1|nr:alpha/beta hydrolase [Haliangium ochraceum]ACY13997.1 alpha/beta hydrolase fold protein [Haliangium ochraceum DSM 14365]
MIDAAPIAAELFDEPARRIDLGHASLPYWRLGDGPDLVLVHGWPADARTWRRIVPALRQRYRCHLIDLPGAGRSTWTRHTPRGCDGLSQALAAAVAQMDLGERFGFVAFDSGGGFARKVAAQMPERVAGLALGNTEIPFEHSRLFRKSLRNLRRPGAKLLMRLAMQSRSLRRKSWHTSASDPALIDELCALFLEPLARRRRRFAGAMLLADGLRVEDFDSVAEAHGNIHAPVKLIWGTRDPWFKLAPARKMAEQFAGPVDFVEIDGGKLFVHEEFPERFADEVAAHFAPLFPR